MLLRPFWGMKIKSLHHDWPSSWLNIFRIPLPQKQWPLRIVQFFSISAENLHVRLGAEARIHGNCDSTCIKMVKKHVFFSGTCTISKMMFNSYLQMKMQQTMANSVAESPCFFSTSYEAQEFEEFFPKASQKSTPSCPEVMVIKVYPRIRVLSLLHRKPK